MIKWTSKITARNLYDKVFNEEDGDWGIVADVLTSPKVIAEELTEEEADAYLKLLRG
jgi:hypothetical protein